MVRFIVRPYQLLVLFAGLLLATATQAQSLAQRKAAQRYEIDAKRMGVDVNGDDALPRSREFKRVDSTYYVGWFFEGAYKYNHAADYLGFKNASVPLERALALMERDYRKELSTRTSDLLTYFNVYKLHTDYTMIAYYLMTCYSNMEDQQSVYNLLRRVVRWNFQRDYYMDAYNYLGWTVHRNRFYTSAKYPFLRNSIDANESLAHSYLDSGMRKIRRDMPLNSKIFLPGYEKMDKLAVYHYKAMLHSYGFDIDSASHYYSLMREAGTLPHSNYATFRVVCGDFREAEKEYQLEAANPQIDKRLQEWVYYSSILYNYKATPKKGVELTRGMITANGSTPGFGWYNLAQARCRLYDGQTTEAERYLNKAAEFKELHIGTTLGQTHYDFSIQLLKLMHKLQQVEAQRFEHRNWWYNFPVLGRLAQLTGEKYLQQFLIINQFSQNPERDRVIYKLFSTESTVSWDEVWYLIKDFSTDFFLSRFQKELSADERKYIHKYFRYFIAKLRMERGEYKEANLLLNEVLLDPDIDVEYEKLLIARTLQAQAECARKQDDPVSYNDRMYRMFQFYPQLIPYTGLPMSMRLSTSGTPPQDFLDRLHATSINFTTDPTIPAPHAHLSFFGQDDKKRVEYYVLDAKGKEIVPKQVLSYKNAQGAVSLAYRLFNIGGTPPIPETDEERSTL